MLNLAKQVVEYYFKNFKKPELKDLNLKNESLLLSKWSVFITFYLSWVVKWSAWNIKEIESNLALEIIENTFNALTADSRFERIDISSKDDIKIRVDHITNRGKPLNDWEIKNINPTNFGVLVIKSDYEKSATILPNISWTLMTWTDFAWVLSNKLDEDFDDKNYLVYKIETSIESNI